MAMNENELDAALLCEEEKWGEGDEGEVVEQDSCENNNGIVNWGRYSKSPCSLFHPQLLLLEQDLFWEDEELVSLFSKEEQQQRHFIKQLERRESRANEAGRSSISMARRAQIQVEDTKFVFEAKTIQRMELLVLSTLQWKMHPVTPISFLDHIVRRLGLKTHLHFEFLKRCERLLFSALFGKQKLQNP